MLLRCMALTNSSRLIRRPYLGLSQSFLYSGVFMCMWSNKIPIIVTMWSGVGVSVNGGSFYVNQCLKAWLVPGVKAIPYRHEDFSVWPINIAVIGFLGHLLAKNGCHTRGDSCSTRSNCVLHSCPAPRGHTLPQFLTLVQSISNLWHVDYHHFDTFLGYGGCASQCSRLFTNSVMLSAIPHNVCVCVCPRACTLYLNDWIMVGWPVHPLHPFPSMC